MHGLLIVFLSAILIHNVLLNRFLGICPFIGTSKETRTALGMSGGVIFVIMLASIVTWLLHRYVLVPLDLVYLRTIAFILVIAALVQFIEMFISKASPVLYRALGIYLPLITTNCAVLGVAILNVQEELNFEESLVRALGVAFGFSLVLLIMATIRERLSLVSVPKAFKGAPLTFILAGILAVTFMGFVGMIK
jgi:electron transport complex protein RnfA